MLLILGVYPCRKSSTYDQLFALALPFAPFFSCQRCGQSRDEDTAVATATVARPTILATYLNVPPSDLLDIAMLNASLGHSMLPAQLPQQFTPEWAEGSLAPERAAALLRTRLQQSHAQLLFERHRREQHGQRNRRLLGRLVHLRSLEADVQTLRKQARLAEEEMLQNRDAHRLDAQQLRNEKQMLLDKLRVSRLSRCAAPRIK